MDAYARLMRRFDAGKNNKIAAIACAALCLICIIGAVFAARGADKEVLYYADGMKKGALCKIDVVKIDRAFAVTENSDYGYFVCMAADGRLFVLKMREAAFETDFAAVYAYTVGEVSAAIPVTFTGRLADMTQELRDIGESYFGGDDFTGYVGALYIDGSAAAQRNYTALWVVGASFFFALGVVNLIVFLKRRIASVRCLRRIQSAGKLQSVVNALDVRNIVWRIGDVVFTREYLICPPKGMAYAYADILWCYGKRTRLYFFAVSKNLTVCDRYGTQTDMLFSKASSKSVDEALALIAARAPHCLFGFSEENKKRYAERTVKK